MGRERKDLLNEQGKKKVVDDAAQPSTYILSNKAANTKGRRKATLQRFTWTGEWIRTGRRPLVE